MRENRFGRSALRTLRRCLAPALLVLLAGCGGRIAKSEIVAVNTSSVTVSTDYALPAEATMLGPVEGVSCARSPFGAKAKRQEAEERMKQDAARMGATGVMHMRVATVGISPSCWYSFVAQGTAYR